MQTSPHPAPRRPSRARAVALVGVTVALAYVASFLQLPFTLPGGGQVSLEPVPLIAFSLLRGPRAGLAAGLVEGVLHFTREPLLLNPWSLLLDYPVAQGALACAGLLCTPGEAPSRLRCAAAASLGIAAKLLVHVVSGVLFFSQARSGATAWWLSLAYNGSYMAGQWLLAVVLVPWLVPDLAAHERR